MKKAVPNTSSPPGTSQPCSTSAPIEKDTQQQKSIVMMQWFILILLSLWIFAAMIATTVAFCITKSPLSFSLFSLLAPPLAFFRRCCLSLFRLDRQDFLIRLEAAKAKRERVTNRLPEAAIMSLLNRIRNYLDKVVDSPTK